MILPQPLIVILHPLLFQNQLIKLSLMQTPAALILILIHLPLKPLHYNFRVLMFPHELSLKLLMYLQFPLIFQHLILQKRVPRRKFLSELALLKQLLIQTLIFLNRDQRGRVQLLLIESLHVLPGLPDLLHHVLLKPLHRLNVTSLHVAHIVLIFLRLDITKLLQFLDFLL